MKPEQTEIASCPVCGSCSRSYRANLYVTENRIECYSTWHDEDPFPAAPPESKPTFAQEEDEQICYLCGAKVEFPADDDPQFIGDTVVRSKCAHYIHVREIAASGPEEFEDYDKPTKDEVWAMVHEHLPHGTGESTVLQLWPLLAELIERRKR